MKRISAILAMLLILCMCFTACSGSESEADIGEISGVIIYSDATINDSSGTGDQESQKDPMSIPATEEVTESTTEPSHVHSWSEANCTDPATCNKCGETYGPAFGHKYADGKCTTCGAADPDYKQEGMVWIPTNGGKKYHTHADCSGMIDPDYVTKSEAEALGFTPCKKCYG